VVVDLDGDLNVDIVTTNSADDTISVLLGDGNGGFALPAVEFAVGSHPVGIAVADLSSDGAPDLMVVSDDDGQLFTLLSRRDRGFGLTYRSVVFVAGSPRSVGAADFDRDGALDLVVTSRGNNTLSLFPGDGIGGFTFQDPLPVIETLETAEADLYLGSVWADVADFDGDSRNDMAVLLRSADGSMDRMVILRGDGRGDYQRSSSFEVPRASSIEIADLNRNGLPDLAVAGSPGTGAYLSDGQGGFTQGWVYPGLDLGSEGFWLWPLEQFKASDFNGDGSIDLAGIANLDVVFLGDGEGDFASDEREPAIEKLYFRNLGGGELALGDVNGDGFDDLVSSTDPNREGDGISLAVVLSDGKGGLVFHSAIRVFDQPAGIVSEDFNQDGHADIAVANRGSGTVSVLLGDGQVNFDRRDFPVAAESTRLVAGDINADGKVDLALSSGSTGVATILVGDGQGGFPDTSFVVDVFGSLRAVQDVDGDGLVDLIFTGPVGQTGVTVASNQLALRADANGSNRVDGQDINLVARLAGTLSEEAEYLRAADVDLSGEIDGTDLTWVASRFGELNETISPLRPSLVPGFPSPEPNTVTLQRGEPMQPRPPEELILDVVVHDTDDPAAAADFSINLIPTAGDEPILELLGFDQGDYLSEGTAQFPFVNSSNPGQVGINISRLPPDLETVGTGPQTLVRVFFRSLGSGSVELEFDAQPGLLDGAGQPIVGVTFVGGTTVNIDDGGEETPPQRVGVSPDSLDFGVVGLGGSKSRSVRISNFGFSNLTVHDVTTSTPEVWTFFVEAFTIEPLGFVDLWVVFEPTSVGDTSGTLTIESSDPGEPTVTLELTGQAVVP
jgi:hypothetical protein